MRLARLLTSFASQLSHMELFQSLFIRMEPLSVLEDAFEATSVRDPLEFEHSSDVAKMVLRQIAASGGIDAWLAQSSVCQLGMHIVMLESQDVSTPESCHAMLAWSSRADVLQTHLADHAGCGTQPALRDLARLPAFEQRMRALQPHRCQQVDRFLGGLRAAITLPSMTLRRNIDNLDNVLHGLQACVSAISRPLVSHACLLSLSSDCASLTHAMTLTTPCLQASWVTDADSPPDMESVPLSQAHLRSVAMWRHESEALGKHIMVISGVLAATEMLRPEALISQLQQWASVVRRRDDALPTSNGLHDLSPTIQAITHQVSAVVNALAPVSAAVLALEAGARELTTAFSDFHTGLSSLNVQDMFANLRLWESVSSIDLDPLAALVDKLDAFMGEASLMSAAMVGHTDSITMEETARELQSLVVARRGSALAQLPEFAMRLPPFISHVAKEVHEKLMTFEKTAIMVSQSAELLSAYLEATRTNAGGAFRKIESMVSTLVPHLDLMAQESTAVLAGVSTVLAGQDTLASLSAAAKRVNQTEFARIMRTSSKLNKMLRNMAPTLVGAKFRSYLATLQKALEQPVVHVSTLDRILPAVPFIDFVHTLPNTVAGQLLQFTVAESASLASHVPAAEPLFEVAGPFFSGLPGLADDLETLKNPNTTCHQNAACRAQVQLHVHDIRQAAHRVSMQLKPLAHLERRIAASFSALLKNEVLFDQIQPELEFVASFESLWFPGQQQAVGVSLVDHIRQVVCTKLQGQAAPAGVVLPMLPPALEASCSMLNSTQSAATNSVQGIDGDSTYTLRQFLEMANETKSLISKLTNATGDLSDMISNASERIVVHALSVSGNVTVVLNDTAATMQAWLTTGDVIRDVQGVTKAMNSIVPFGSRLAELPQVFEEVTSTQHFNELKINVHNALYHFAQIGLSDASLSDCVEGPDSIPAFLGFDAAIRDAHTQLEYEKSTPNVLVPISIISGLGRAACYTAKGGMLLRQDMGTMVPPLQAEARSLSQGKPKFLPVCPQSDKYCLAIIARGPVLYRLVIFPVVFMHFWSLGQRPLADPCTHLGHFAINRFTAPGLYSRYAMQSATFLEHSLFNAGVVCNAYTHLLGYASALGRDDCDTELRSFLATTDQLGTITRVYPTDKPSGERYQGSLTGLAVAPELGTAWACGKTEGDSFWSVHAFQLHHLRGSWTKVTPGEHTEERVRMCRTEKVAHSNLGTLNSAAWRAGKARCNLHWDHANQLLWVSSLAQPDESGAAYAYSVSPMACSGQQGSVSMITGHIISTMKLGSYVTSLSTFTDLLGDHYLALARCDNLIRNSAPCVNEFRHCPRCSPCRPLMPLLSDFCTWSLCSVGVRWSSILHRAIRMV